MPTGLITAPLPTTDLGPELASSSTGPPQAPPFGPAHASTPQGSQESVAPNRVSRAFGGLVAGGVAGKLLGVLRELALAASFGTNAEVGAFRASHTASSIPTHFFTKHSLNGGFIPLCARYVDEDPTRANALFWSVTAAMTVVSITIGTALFLGADFIAGVLVPGFGVEAQRTTAAMTRVMALGAPFVVLSSLLSYLEMAHGSYTVESFRTIMQNVGLLGGIGAAVVLKDPLYLAWGFNAYLLLYCGMGTWRVVRLRLASWPRAWAWAETRGVLTEFLHLTAPLFVLPVAIQAASAVERIVASLVSEGAVASLDYARTVSETGLALIAIPLGFIGLAELGRLGDAEARHRIRETLPPLLIVLLPVSALLAVQAEGVVRLLFARGQFGAESVTTTSAILVGLAIGFWAHVAGYVLLKVLNARARHRTALTVTGLAAIAHIAANVGLYGSLGPLALGLGGTVFGLVTFWLAADALKLVGLAVETLVPLLIGTAIYLPLGLMMESGTLSQLMSSSTVGVLFWIGFIAMVPRLRAAVRGKHLGSPGSLSVAGRSRPIPPP